MMKKTIRKGIKIAALIVSLAILFLNISVTGSTNGQEVALVNLFKANNVNAECLPLNSPGTLPGVCNVFDRCHQDFEPSDCGY